MFRDNRDPETIGNAIISLHQVSPDVPVTQIADQYLQPGTAHRWYGETQEEFESRIYGGFHPSHRSNGKLAA